MIISFVCLENNLITQCSYRIIQLWITKANVFHDIYDKTKYYNIVKEKMQAYGYEHTKI